MRINKKQLTSLVVVGACLFVVAGTATAQSAPNTLASFPTGPFTSSMTQTTAISGSAGTNPASSAVSSPNASEFCDETINITTGISNGSADGQGDVTCEEETEVEDVTEKLWQRNSNGNYTLIAIDSGADGTASPSWTDSVIAGKCKKGDNIHMEFIGTLEYDGGNTGFDDNSQPEVCQ